MFLSASRDFLFITEDNEMNIIKMKMGSSDQCVIVEYAKVTHESSFDLQRKTRRVQINVRKRQFLLGGLLMV